MDRFARVYGVRFSVALSLALLVGCTQALVFGLEFAPREESDSPGGFAIFFGLVFWTLVISFIVALVKALREGHHGPNPVPQSPGNAAPASNPYILNRADELRCALPRDENLLDPAFQRNLLWRHRRSFFKAFNDWRPGDGALELPPFPMAVPVSRWRADSADLNNAALCEYLTTHDPLILKILQAKQSLCQEAERVVVRPSTANDHLSVLEARLQELHRLTAKAAELEARIRNRADLTEAERDQQAEWVRELCEQQVRDLLKEHNDGTNTDEVISPE